MKCRGDSAFKSSEFLLQSLSPSNRSAKKSRGQKTCDCLLCLSFDDVILLGNQQADKIADSELCDLNKKKVKRRSDAGRYCVAGYPNKRSCKNTSILRVSKMYEFPKDPQLRAKWAKFVQRNRPNFSVPPPGKSVSLCSAHFKDFNRPRLSLERMEHLKFSQRLIPGSVPTEDKEQTCTKEKQQMSTREQRHVSNIKTK